MADRLLDRRRVLVGLSATGAGSVVFGRALAALAEQSGTVTIEMIRQAENLQDPLPLHDDVDKVPPFLVKSV